MFTTDLLFSSPRLQFSQAQQKAILSWANELLAKNVPTLHVLKKCQETIRHLVGNPTEKVATKSGYIFYQNSIGKAIAKVWTLIHYFKYSMHSVLGLFEPDYTVFYARLPQRWRGQYVLGAPWLQNAIRPPSVPCGALCFRK
ncbi:hypothetical protein SERLA73DRAFT_173897 [Serpula lacrymans var. lacrymans S7.3]|uniref:Uncharacterized protein n=2 Tax=Serpula lacrymans var. lacrymans TaxID=341189 RepID=F8PF02_SERL3|nr:uncharacterized protein SERLADRAFT_454831 [Serpula lacrymans var. lacrymans S7.9]EGO04675.1 hypothetical protein SERLA73DRAFT_173897 [Serpula lacrymans var. lacrymans S7.3]EGO30527.1 hypothetical protein SERLADRAFT_454831 [Serpula lacrymans var. lacrymans S7.9]